MKDAIKIGDLFIVHERFAEEEQGFWYQLGNKVGCATRIYSSWRRKSKMNQERLSTKKRIQIQSIDYSQYESPAVYRKWRSK